LTIQTARLDPPEGGCAADAIGGHGELENRTPSLTPAQLPEIEISGGHPHRGEGPHVKVMKFDPDKGEKGGFRVIEKIFTELGR